MSFVVDTSRDAWDSVIELGREYRLSAYDAAYLSLALRTGLPLATQDSDLTVAARRAGVPILD